MHKSTAIGLVEFAKEEIMKSKRMAILVLVLLMVISCNIPNPLTSNEPTPDPIETDELSDSTDSANIQTEPMILPQPGDANSVIQVTDLEYLGAFRLPEASGESSWEYSGRGLTYYPAGDPQGSVDGFQGSLFGVGLDQQNFVSEISIPVPVISRNLDDLNTAETLQPFADITEGMFGETDIPRLGIQYLPAAEGGAEGRIHFVHGKHFQDFQPSHGSSSLQLSEPDAVGPWIFDGYTNYVTSDYIFEIPAEWAQYIPGSPRLATGRFREGIWGGRGPTLFAYDPPEDLAAGATLTGITPLLLYGVQDPGQTDIVSDESQKMALYNEDDSWWGGAWLTKEDRSAVIFVGTKGQGKSWYGFANGVVWEYDCADSTPATCPDVPEWPYENRGYWAEDYAPQILFYDPADLVNVANGQLESWQPQPYAVLDLTDTFYQPEISLENYKFDIAGAVAFDRENGLIYLFERLADGYKSVIHVWRIN